VKNASTSPWVSQPASAAMPTAMTAEPGSAKATGNPAPSAVIMSRIRSAMKKTSIGPAQVS
jgi:hypothetical protein